MFARARHIKRYIIYKCKKKKTHSHGRPYTRLRPNFVLRTMCWIHDFRLQRNHNSKVLSSNKASLKDASNVWLSSSPITPPLPSLGAVKPVGRRIVRPGGRLTYYKEENQTVEMHLCKASIDSL